MLLLTFSWSWGSRSCWGGGGRCRRLTTSAVLTVETPATVGVSTAVLSLTSTAEINDKHRDDEIYDNDD